MNIKGRNSTFKSRCLGFTLIELMISLVIGAIILTAAGGMVQTSAKTRNIVRNTAWLQEEAFFVSHTLRQQLAQAGYRGIDPALLSGRTIPINNHNNSFQSETGEWGQGQFIRVKNNILSYRFGGASASDGTADNSIFDCLGNALPFGPLYETQISLQTNQLICTVGTQSTVLLGSDQGMLVEQMVYQLGVDSDSDGDIDKMIAPAAASTADYLNTRHITLRLLIATQDNNVLENQLYRFNGVETKASDNRLRSEIVVSVAIRN